MMKPSVLLAEVALVRARPRRQHGPLTEGRHDVPFTAPLVRMRRTVTQVRALLRGERIPLAVASGARPLKLNLPPAPDLPIYLAALADRSVRLTGEVADGWLLFLYPRDRLEEGIALLREGAAAAGDAGRRHAVWPTVPTVVSDDPAEARERIARWAADGADVTCVFLRPHLGPEEIAFTLEAFRPMLESGTVARV